MGLTRRRFGLGGAAASLSFQAKLANAKSAWPGSARAAVSLTYDDGYDSQLDNAAPVLAELSLSATFFLTVRNMQARLADWKMLAEKGHEIGNHTMTHPCNLGAYSAKRFMEEEILPAEHYFDDNFGGPRPRCFAYPCGFEGLGKGNTRQRVRRYENDLRKTFLAARTVNGPPNDPRDVVRERFFLNGFEPTYDFDSSHLAAAYLREALNHGYWAILIFHEVLDTRKGEEDTSKLVHRAILEQITREAIWCAPMRTVFNHVTGLG